MAETEGGVLDQHQHQHSAYNKEGKRKPSKSIMAKNQNTTIEKKPERELVTHVIVRGRTTSESPSRHPQLLPAFDPLKATAPPPQHISMTSAPCGVHIPF